MYRRTNAETTIDNSRLLEWLRSYGHDSRNIFLHPEDVEYVNEAGVRTRPLRETALNIDNPTIDDIKMEFIESDYFNHLPIENRLRIGGRLGLSNDMRRALIRKNKYKYFFDSGVVTN